jgi:hypothetical protein
LRVVFTLLQLRNFKDGLKLLGQNLFPNLRADFFQFGCTKLAETR